MHIVLALLFIIGYSSAIKVKSCEFEHTCLKNERCFRIDVDRKLGQLCFVKGNQGSRLSPSNLDATTEPCGADSTLKCQNGGSCLRVIVGQYHKDICICPSLSNGDQCENWGRQISVTMTNFTDASTKVAVDKANTKAFLSNGGNGAGVSAAMFNIDGGSVGFNCDFNLPVSQASSISYNDVTNDLEMSLELGQSIIFMNIPNYDARNLRWAHSPSKISSTTTDNYGNTFAILTSYEEIHVSVYNSDGVEIASIVTNIYNYGSYEVAICPASKILVISGLGQTGYFFELHYMNNTVDLTPATQHDFDEFGNGLKEIAIDAFGNVVVAGTKDYGVDSIGVYKYSTSTNNWFQHMVQIDSHYSNYFWITGFWVDQGLVYAVASNDNEHVKIYVVEYMDSNHTFTTIAPDQNSTIITTTPMNEHTTPIGNGTMPMESTTPMQGNYTTPIRNVTLPMKSTTPMVMPSTTAQDPCLNNPCMNNGTCSYDSTVGVTCTCITMCHGIHCETCSKPNGCAGNMCNEGSTCQPVDATNYVCICAPGYSGTYCYTSG